MKKLLTIIAVMGLMLININCKETKDVINTASNVSLDGAYLVSTIDGNTNRSQALTLNFNALNKIISGNAGCNEFSGSYSIDVFALSIGVLAATQAYCDEPVMKLENSYFNALKNTGSYGIKDKVLTLYSKTDRSPILTAKRAN